MMYPPCDVPAQFWPADAGADHAPYVEAHLTYADGREEWWHWPRPSECDRAEGAWYVRWQARMSGADPGTGAYWCSYCVMAWRLGVVLLPASVELTRRVWSVDHWSGVVVFRGRIGPVR